VKAALPSNKRLIRPSGTLGGLRGLAVRRRASQTSGWPSSRKKMFVEINPGDGRRTRHKDGSWVWVTDRGPHSRLRTEASVSPCGIAKAWSDCRTTLPDGGVLRASHQRSKYQKGATLSCWARESTPSRPTATTRGLTGMQAPKDTLCNRAGEETLSGRRMQFLCDAVQLHRVTRLVTAAQERERG